MPIPSAFPIHRSKEDWQKIVSLMDRHRWGDFTLDRQGDLTEWLTTHAPSRYQGVWNQIVRELRPQVQAWISEHIAGADAEPISTALQWDLLHVLVEERYADLARAPLFFTRHVLPCYERGTIPYGWSGDYPAGEVLAT